MKTVQGGVCAAKGFKAAGIHCGIRRNRSKKDLALIVSEKLASAACTYTQNLVKGAPIAVTRQHVANGTAQAIICNSGNANTCNTNGEQIAIETCKLLEKYSGIKEDDIIVSSTGVIGQTMSIEPFKNGMQELVDSLGDNSEDAANAIMTTDTKLKEIAAEFTVGGKKVHIGGIAKGSGMIHPNMATMLVFITTDVAISPEKLQEALSEDVKCSFNMISIDGDTSTNDMVAVLANGMAENEEIVANGEDFDAFKEALAFVTHYLCRCIAKDGEGASKLIECKTYGAKTLEAARVSAKSVITSSLVKAAMFGSDANWGRVLCAVGYSGADVDVTKLDVTLQSQKGTIEVCKQGCGVDFLEDKAKEILSEDEIVINVYLNSGEYTATAWGCDLTYDYVRINGDYRT